MSEETPPHKLGVLTLQQKYLAMHTITGPHDLKIGSRLVESEFFQTSLQCGDFQHSRHVLITCAEANSKVLAEF